MLNYCKSITALGLALFSLSGCGVSLKPEHQQAYQAFDERRVPVQNALVQQGSYADQFASEPRSQFVPYVGGVGNAAQTQQPVPGGSPVVAGQQAAAPAAVSGSGGVMQQQGAATPLGQTPQNSGESGGDSSGVLNKIKQLFSAVDLGIVSEERYVPAENLAIHTPIENLAMHTITEYPHEIEQGSTSLGYNYYDLADEIISSYTYDHDALYAPVLMADGRNAAASLVEVPEVQSHDQIKSDAMQKPQVELRETKVVPVQSPTVQEKQAPEHQEPQVHNEHNEPTIMKHEQQHRRKPHQNQRHKPHSHKHKVVQQHHHKSEGSGHRIKDERATLQYYDGRQVVMGNLSRKGN